MLAVTANGHLFAWGDNSRGQCGLAWPPSPSLSSSFSSSFQGDAEADTDASSTDSSSKEGDGDDEWWDDYGGKQGVSSHDLENLVEADDGRRGNGEERSSADVGGEGERDIEEEKKPEEEGNGYGRSGGRCKKVDLSWGDKRRGGIGGGPREGAGPLVVGRPTLVRAVHFCVVFFCLFFCRFGRVLP